ncbi:hypothetical protein M422DRAFT_243472 [Sphaerobolus stellatus SS14]|nr:hypothetical protein M422DRAFT_243472 [Sphaerobolus stellatus SS14]
MHVPLVLPTALPRPPSKPSQKTSERPESTASTSSAKPSDTPKPLTASASKKTAEYDPWEPVFDDLPTLPRSPSSMFTRDVPYKEDGLSVVGILYYYVNSSHADIKRHVLPIVLLSPVCMGEVTASDYSGLIPKTSSWLLLQVILVPIPSLSSTFYVSSSSCFQYTGFLTPILATTFAPCVLSPLFCCLAPFDLHYIPTTFNILSR